MKLGTKIILGFVVVCAIFIAVSAVALLNLYKISSDTVDLRDKIMPGNTTVSHLETAISQVAIYVTDYSYSAKDEVFKQAEATGATARDLIDSFKNMMRDGLASNNPKVRDLAAKVETDYMSYAAIVHELPTLNNQMTEQRTSVIKIYTNMAKTLADFIDDQAKVVQDTMASVASGATAIGDLSARSAQVNLAMDIQESGSQLYIGLLRGLYYQDPELFGQSYDIAVKTTDLTKNLLAGSRSQATRDIINGILTDSQDLAAALLTFKDIYTKFHELGLRRVESRNTLLKSIAELDDAMTGMANDFADTTTASTATALLTQVIGVIVAVVVSLVLALFLTRGITGPMNHIIEVLTEGAQEVDSASGQLS